MVFTSAVNFLVVNLVTTRILYFYGMIILNGIFSSKGSNENSD